MPYVRVAAWNIERLFSHGGLELQKRFFEEMEGLTPDVMVCPEAFCRKDEGLDVEEWRRYVSQQIGPKGLEARFLQYGESRDALEQMNMLVVARPIEAQYCWLDCGVRRVAKISTGDGLTIYGLHLSDYSEDERQMTIDAISADIDTLSRDAPVVVMGDFNAMWEKDLRARAVRLVGRMLAKILPAPTRGTDYVERPSGTFFEKVGWNLQFIHSLATRVIEMASGKTMERFVAMGFTEADESYRPTETLHNRQFPDWVPAVGVLQLDHILVRNCRAKDFIIHKSKISDHRAISCRIEY